MDEGERMKGLLGQFEEFCSSPRSVAMSDQFEAEVSDLVSRLTAFALGIAAAAQADDVEQALKGEMLLLAWMKGLSAGQVHTVLRGAGEVLMQAMISDAGFSDDPLGFIKHREQACTCGHGETGHAD